MDDSLFELELKSFAFGGMAVGRLPSGKVCFVRGAAPGERVLAKTVSDKRTHMFATLVKLLEPSPRRCDTGCPLAPGPDAGGCGETSQCPGCSYRHVPYEDELSAKDAQLRDFAVRWLKLEPEGIVQTPHAAPMRDRWRNKIVLNCVDTPNGVKAGYTAADNHTLVPLANCPLAREGIQSLLKAPGQFSAGDRLTFRETLRDGAMLWRDKPDAAAEPLTETLPQGDFLVPRGSFFQVNNDVAGALLSFAAATVSSLHPELLLDMYCGVGVFSIVGAKAGVERVEGCEIDARAIEFAKANARNAGLRNCHFTAGDAARNFKRLAAGSVMRRTALLLDPPRGGLDPKALRSAVSLKAKHVLYVSCAADALCRDIKAFMAVGYSVRLLKVFDMFPSTAHFETFALLELP
jgi:23S rRNA (uracil1939-C5)-methyltransferase